MKNILFLTTLIASVAVMAATAGSGHDDNHIPIRQIGWQAANLGVLIIILVYTSRKGIANAFAQRKAEFISQSEKTKHALKQAEAELSDIKTKLAALESGEKTSIEKAHHEANLLAAHMISEAEAQAGKLQTDAALTIGNDTLKAREEINQIILSNAIEAATQKMAATPSQTMKTIETTFLASVDSAQSTKAAL